MSESSPMTDAKHTLPFEYEQTPEPWHLAHDGTTVRRWKPEVVGGTSIASFTHRCNNDEQGDSDDEREYAERIARLNASRCVACVNALSGIPHPADFVKAAMEFSRAVGIALSGDASDNWEQRIRGALKAFRAAGGGETELNRGDAAD